MDILELSKEGLQARREYARKWREANKEKLYQSQKAWREKNKEHIAEYHKEWRNKPENKGKVAEYQARYWERKGQETAK